jgi:hypothetical protein
VSGNPWTPGPWVVRVAGPNHYPYAITAPDVPWDKKGAIRDITRWAAISVPSSPEGQANARLIAAAPEMAELLEQTLIGIGMGWALDGYTDSIRALLSRIRGETP